MGASCSQDSGDSQRNQKQQLANSRGRQTYDSQTIRPSVNPRITIESTRGPSETVSSHFSRRTTNRSRLSTLNDSYSFEYAQQVLLDAYKGNLDIVNKHIKEGFAVDFPLNQSGWTLAHIAAQMKNLEMLETLIKYKCDLDIQEIGEGWTPIMVAAINNSIEIAKMLIKYNADLSIKDNSQMTAIQLAEKYRSREVYEVLVGGVRNR
ncbi:unnamed protein product [Blepharisma stoltei]|uniref:Uncharacterized protein n=1 Tax=Blepharisma stoltei TaxID=1481888 RepID=A0AAU9IQ04_9CILI|nr:unnamed protein product [Blepharisma stoltei]